MTETAQESSKGPRRQKTYLGWESHGRIIVRFLLLWGIYHLTLWQVLCVRDYIQQVSSGPGLEPRMSLTTFFEGFVRQNGWMVVYAAAFTGLLLWHLVSLTHRIVGPLKRVEEALYGMIEGKSIRQIEFRDGDLIKDFERAFNAYLAFLYGSDCEAKEAAAGRNVAVAESNAVSSADDDPDSHEQHLADLLREFRGPGLPEVELVRKDS